MTTEGNRHNPYSFDDYLLVRDSFDYYRDDELLQALVRRHTGAEHEEIHRRLPELSRQVSFRYRDLAAAAASLDNRLRCTRVEHFDAFNHRVDRLDRCQETEQLEREAFDLGLFDPQRNTAWSRFCALFLLAQNGEHGVMCPLACTHGLVALLQKYEPDAELLGPEARQLLAFVRDGQANGAARRYGRGAQFVTEIQGGSDVPSNLLEAVLEPERGADGVAGCWRLYGKKFFCSATQADVALVTAKPKGTPSATKIAAFVVPAYLPGSQVRNGYTIDRLKPKLGTAELPTAEISYHGAVAYPVGPLERGLADVVGIVLTLSRLHVALGMAAALLRAAREASWYAQFRTAFGLPVASFPLLQSQLDELSSCARRTAAGLFKIYGEHVALGEQLTAGFKELLAIADPAERRRHFRLRELILLQKIVVAHDAPAMLRLAISFFGGHGIMEDFSALPRLLRDSLIMELWEGPRNVLLTQIHRDFSRAKDWCSATDFCRDLLAGGDEQQAAELGRRLQRVMDHPSLLSPGAETLQICREWQELAGDLLHAYQQQALAELGPLAPPPTFAERLRQL